VNTWLLQINSLYKINSHNLTKVKSAKYLDVIITHNLSWHDRIVSICNKANLTCALLQKNLKQCSPFIKSLAYLTCQTHIGICLNRVWLPCCYNSVGNRRTNAITVIFYKITDNLICINFSQDLPPVLSSGATVTDSLVYLLE